jgi:GNAT superfamily N-acetyltransferase
MELWGPDRCSELAALAEAAMPHERLTADELLACCWDDPGVVLGLPDGRGAVAACVQQHGDRTVGFLKLVAVEPVAQRLGHGTALLAAAEAWAFGHGAAEVRAGASAPFYLWPGVDVRATGALCLFEAAGYLAGGAELNMSCPATFRAKPPAGIEVRRVLEDPDAMAVVALTRAHWPNWEAELTRAIEHGSCHAGFADDGAAVGYGCHSVNRAGWVGPMATDPTRQHRGVGAALLGEVCRDLMTAGYPDAEISWVGPVGFYAKAAGASVSRVFRSLRKPAPARSRAT